MHHNMVAAEFLRRRHRKFEEHLVVLDDRLKHLHVALLDHDIVADTGKDRVGWNLAGEHHRQPGHTWKHTRDKAIRQCRGRHTPCIKHEFKRTGLTLARGQEA